MTQESEQLVLKDLCGRLTYGVKIQVNDKIETLESIDIFDNTIGYDSFLASNLEEVKPYLFPLSSITKEHRKEISEILKDININHPPYGLINPNGCDALLTTVTMQGAALIEFYNKYHYDYNGLIPKGSAIDATGIGIYGNR